MKAQHRPVSKQRPQLRIILSTRPLSLSLPLTRPLQRMHPAGLKLSRQVVGIHDIGVYHRDLGVHSVILNNFALKTTFGAGDVHMVGYERAGTVSDRFRKEVGF